MRRANFHCGLRGGGGGEHINFHCGARGGGGGGRRAGEARGSRAAGQFAVYEVVGAKDVAVYEVVGASTWWGRRTAGQFAVYEVVGAKDRARREGAVRISGWRTDKRVREPCGSPICGVGGGGGGRILKSLWAARWCWTRPVK